MSEAMSHIITFQSLEEVNINREFRDQLLKAINTHGTPDGLRYALNTGNALDMTF